MRTQCKHLQSEYEISIDALVESHENGEAFSPTDLVVTALGSCLLTIMGITANTHGINMDKSLARVTKFMYTNVSRTVFKTSGILISIFLASFIALLIWIILNRFRSFKLSSKMAFGPYLIISAVFVKSLNIVNLISDVVFQTV